VECLLNAGMTDEQVLEGYVGRTFGERSVLGPLRRGRNSLRYILCRCDAGHEAWVRLSHLNCGTGGVCKTCHCRRIATRHGEAGSDISKSSSTYKAWVNMIRRVNSDESYLARGIGVCDRWRIFENFKADMGEPPDKRMELDRRDGTKGYSPENCRWLTKKQNNSNRTNLRMISFAGMTMCVADWEKYLNLPEDKLRKKLRFNRPLDTIMAECGFIP
jgi:hypothetical protein